MATKSEYLIDFCRGLFCNTSNLIGSDITDVNVERVNADFPQDRSGIKVTFTVSNHFIGKTDNNVQVPLDMLEKMAFLKVEESSDVKID